jgi:hypothetical protein
LRFHSEVPSRPKPCIEVTLTILTIQLV